MGMSAAMKNAVTLLMEVRATLAPVLFRHSPVRSLSRQKERKSNETFDQSLARGTRVILEIMYHYRDTDMTDSDYDVS